MFAGLSERKCAKGQVLRPLRLSTQPEKEVSASDAPRAVSHLNFVELVAAGGFRHLSSGRGIPNASGAMARGESVPALPTVRP